MYRESIIWQGDPGRTLQFWRVTEVNQKPCSEAAEVRYVDPGPTVEDLAAALRAQPKRRGDPAEPVTLDGYEGLYLELRFPRRFDPEACPNEYTAWQSVSPLGSTADK